jgi:hypothetical protein
LFLISRCICRSLIPTNLNSPPKVCLWPCISNYSNFHLTIWVTIKERNVSSIRKTFQRVHNHSFFNVILDLSSNCHHVWFQLKSCVGPSLGAWHFVHLIILFFRMAFNILSLTLHIKLGLLHHIIHGFSWCICGQAIDVIWMHLLCCIHGGNHTGTHDVVWDSFASIVRDVRFHVLHKQTHVLLMSFL